MADITMCLGKDCEIKHQCYRYTATPSNYQSYFSEIPNKNNFGCNEYWDNDRRVDWVTKKRK